MGGDNGSGHYWEARADCLPLIKKLQISGAPNESTSAAQVGLGDATGSGPDGRVLGASRVQGGTRVFRNGHRRRTEPSSTAGGFEHNYTKLV